MKTFWIDFVCTVFFVFICVLLGYTIGCTYYRAKAVEVGAGRYTVNEKTGATKFEFITNKPVDK